MKKKNKLCNSISPTAAIGGWVYYAFELLFLPTILILAGGRLGLSDAVVNFVYFLLNFVAVTAIFREYLSDSLTHAGKNMAAFLRAIVLGFLCYETANFLIGAVVTALAPDFANVNDQNIAGMAAGYPVLMLIGTVALVPVAEECLFRGLIFSQLHRTNRIAAYAVSCLAFCAVHISGYIGVYPAGTLLLCFLQYIPAGLCLAWAYEHSGTILAPIFIHTAVNAAAMLAL